MSIELFNYLTTYNTDFQDRKPALSLPKECVKFDIVEENYKKLIKHKKIPQMDMETLSQYSQSTFIPFDTFYRNKETVTKKPSDKFINYEPEIVSQEKQNKFRKSQPKVYMVPQICLNNIPEEIMYSKGGFVDNLYTSDWKRANEISGYKPKEHLKMDTVLQTFGEPVRFKNSHVCLPLDSKLYEHVEKWDKERLRSGSNINPTDEFWRKKNYAKLCKPTSDKLLTTAESENLKTLIKENKLSQFYDTVIPGYSGFVPKLAVGVKPERKLFTRSEPYVTAYMEFLGAYKRL